MLPDEVSVRRGLLLLNATTDAFCSDVSSQRALLAFRKSIARPEIDPESLPNRLQHCDYSYGAHDFIQCWIRTKNLRLESVSVVLTVRR